MKKDNYHIAFVNLDHRTDRLKHMEQQLAAAGIEATRVRGMYPHEYTGDRNRVLKMQNRTPGAIGCHFSQVRIMKEALAFGRHAWVMEDDLIFCSDFQKRMDYIENWMQTHEWDVIWLGASFHVGPPWWHRKGHRERELDDCKCTLGRDAETTDDPRMMRTYGAFATFAYIVNKNSIQKVVDLLDAHLHTSIGIDWLFIKLGPQLKTFSFVPGCVRQMDNQSDIGNGVTMWSGFLQLNGTKENSAYVYQDKMEDFDPYSFDWKEALWVRAVENDLYQKP